MLVRAIAHLQSLHRVPLLNLIRCRHAKAAPQMIRKPLIGDIMHCTMLVDYKLCHRSPELKSARR